MKKLRITVGQKVYEVTVEELDEGRESGIRSVSKLLQGTPEQAVTPSIRPSSVDSNDAGAITSPMAGTVFKIKVREGDEVKANQLVLVLEAMKMETSVISAVDGVVSRILVTEGAAVEEGQLLIQLT